LLQLAIWTRRKPRKTFLDIDPIHSRAVPDIRGRPLFFVSN